MIFQHFYQFSLVEYHAKGKLHIAYLKVLPKTVPDDKV